MSQYEPRGQGNACLGGVDPAPLRVILVAGTTWEHRLDSVPGKAMLNPSDVELGV